VESYKVVFFFGFINKIAVFGQTCHLYFVEVNNSENAYYSYRLRVVRECIVSSRSLLIYYRAVVCKLISVVAIIFCNVNILSIWQFSSRVWLTRNGDIKTAMEMVNNMEK